MDKPWLASYPPGVPVDVDVSRYPSLVSLLEESFAKFRKRNAYTCMGRFLTYGELDALSSAFAGYLQSLGLERGARVALMMPNVLQYPIAAAAVLRAGYIAVNVNPMYTPRELEHQLKDSGAVAIVILENFAATLTQVIAHMQGENPALHRCLIDVAADNSTAIAFYARQGFVEIARRRKYYAHGADAIVMEKILSVV